MTDTLAVGGWSVNPLTPTGHKWRLKPVWHRML